MDKRAVSPDSSTQITEKRKKEKKRKKKHRLIGLVELKFLPVNWKIYFAKHPTRGNLPQIFGNNINNVYQKRVYLHFIYRAFYHGQPGGPDVCLKK